MPHTAHTLSHRPRRALIRAAALAAAALAAPALATIPAITNLGVLPGDIASQTTGISRDGSTVVGVSNNHAFRWTSSGGMQDLGMFAGATAATARAANADGSVVVGYCDLPTGRRSFRWTSGVGLQNLGAAPSVTGDVTAYAVSADGNVIVGDVGVGAASFRWTPGAGIQEVYPGNPANAMASSARGVSADGSVLVGNAATPFRWTPPGSTVFLQSPGASSTACGVSGDGQITVGSSNIGGGSFRAVRWNAAGVMDILGQLDGNSTTALATSGDGSVVVGFATGGHAFIWSQAVGLRDLGSFLASLGTNTTGWQFQFASAISDDGNTIAGHGLFNGQTRSFVVTIPSPGVAASAACIGLIASARRRRR